MAEGPEWLIATNAFSMECTNDQYIEIDATHPRKPVVTIRMTKDGDNKSYARAAPAVAAYCMFGRYETFGVRSGKVKAIEGKTRGQGHQECPMYDLEQARKLSGYPCAIADMPHTVVVADADIPQGNCVNILDDFYLHWMPNGKCINTHIQPNDSKLLNVQAQMRWGDVNQPDAHSLGWSGGKRLFYATIAGQKFDVAYKLETHGRDNRFPFLSFAAVDDSGKSIPMKSFPQSEAVLWLIENWDSFVVPTAERHGCDLCNCTAERLKAAYTCGPHVLNEVLGYADCQVRYNELDIKMSGKVHDMPMHDSSDGEDDKPKETNKAVQLPDEAKKTKPKKEREKKSKAKTDNNSGGGSCNGGDETVFVRVNKSAKVKQFKHGAFDTDIRPQPALIRVLGTWPCLEIQGIKPGDCIMPVKDMDGKVHQVKVKVE